jgi:hypothetical protein
MHSALDHGIGRFGVHDIQDRMNHLIAFDAEERRSENRLRLLRRENDDWRFPGIVQSSASALASKAVSVKARSR